jgi:hypothetical protein
MKIRADAAAPLRSGSTLPTRRHGIGTLPPTGRGSTYRNRNAVSTKPATSPARGQLSRNAMAHRIGGHVRVEPSRIPHGLECTSDLAHRVPPVGDDGALCTLDPRNNPIRHREDWPTFLGLHAARAVQVDRPSLDVALISAQLQQSLRAPGGRDGPGSRSQGRRSESGGNIRDLRRTDSGRVSMPRRRPGRYR